VIWMAWIKKLYIVIPKRISISIVGDGSLRNMPLARFRDRHACISFLSVFVSLMFAFAFFFYSFSYVAVFPD